MRRDGKCRRMWRLKKLRPTKREMTTPLFLLRCIQLGLSKADLDLLFIGFKFLQKKVLHVSNVLSETVIFCVFNGQDAEPFTFKFGD